MYVSLCMFPFLYTCCSLLAENPSPPVLYSTRPWMVSNIWIYMNNGIIQLKWVLHKQPMSRSRLSLCVGVCNRETLLSFLQLPQPRDFPFLEIRIRATLSLIEHHRTALFACLCVSAGMFFFFFCTRPFSTVCVYTESMHLSGSVYLWEDDAINDWGSVSDYTCQRR